MAHIGQERYSKLVLAKLRDELCLKDGVVFNNDYEGDPTAGSVKIPVRDKEVAVSDYNKASGIAAASGDTTYMTVTIDKDKAVNEIIDGYDAAAVPDNIVAERLDSAGYSLAAQIDTDGGTALIAGATVTNIELLTKDNIYAAIVDLRRDMTKAKVANDGKRYLLVTPDAMSLVLKSPEFVAASSLGDTVKETGVVGRIAGFNVIEWNDTTANLAMIAGHPRFATRVNEWQQSVDIVDLKGSGNYIGASAVQGRMVYAHKVLRSEAIRAVYAPGSLTVTLSQGSASGNTLATVSGGGTLAYKVNPAERAVFNQTKTAYNGTELTSGSTDIPAKAGDIIEVVKFDSSKVTAVGYVTVKGSDIKVEE